MTTVLKLIRQLVEFEEGFASAYGCEELLRSLGEMQQEVVGRLGDLHSRQINDLQEHADDLRDTIRWHEGTIAIKNEELAALRREKLEASIADGSLLAQAKERLVEQGGNPEVDKIPLIKAVREIGNIGLKEAKDIVDAYYHKVLVDRVLEATKEVN